MATMNLHLLRDNNSIIRAAIIINMKIMDIIKETLRIIIDKMKMIFLVIYWINLCGF